MHRPAKNESWKKYCHRMMSLYMYSGAIRRTGLNRARVLRRLGDDIARSVGGSHHDTEADAEVARLTRHILRLEAQIRSLYTQWRASKRDQRIDDLRAAVRSAGREISRL